MNNVLGSTAIEFGCDGCRMLLVKPKSARVKVFVAVYSRTEGVDEDRE